MILLFALRHIEIFHPAFRYNVSINPYMWLHPDLVSPRGQHPPCKKLIFLVIFLYLLIVFLLYQLMIFKAFTSVPSPEFDLISKSSIKRLTPGKPAPSPRDVV